MIIEYLRPKTIPEALALLKRRNPLTYPMGGGTYINRPKDDPFAVVDLQYLGLNDTTIKGNIVKLGAAVTLQNILELEGLPADLYKVIKLETTYNLRQMATIAGTLVTATGRSPLATLLLSMDASMEILELEKDPQQVKLGDWLPIREIREVGTLISNISFHANINVSSESIARTPADQAIVCAAVSQWPSGRTRLALGGFGQAPALGMDGPESEGVDRAAKFTYSNAGDEWASAEYRSEMAEILATRCLTRINQEKVS
jgi:CO/xanthine dehydrogenase FAD-binding subunit